MISADYFKIICWNICFLCTFSKLSFRI